MRIAIIGAGGVGTTLGARFTEAGHDVVYGVRRPDDPKHTTIGPVATVADAVAVSELIVLATPWSGVADALAAAGDFGGRVLVDATNPIGPGMVLVVGTTDSGAEQVARLARGARVVKAFNTIGREVMAAPRFAGGAAALWLCGDDIEACDRVAALARDIGFEPVRLGPLARARATEPAALVWITATATLGREFAWGILRR